MEQCEETEEGESKAPKKKTRRKGQSWLKQINYNR